MNANVQHVECTSLYIDLLGHAAPPNKHPRSHVMSAPTIMCKNKPQMANQQAWPLNRHGPRTNRTKAKSYCCERVSKLQSNVHVSSVPTNNKFMSIPFPQHYQLQNMEMTCTPNFDSAWRLSSAVLKGEMKGK